METKYIRAVGILLVLYICVRGSQSQAAKAIGPSRTCQVPRPCPILIVVHRPCGFFGQICFDYIFVQQTCLNTEPCSIVHANGGDHDVRRREVPASDSSHGGHSGLVPCDTQDGFRCFVAPPTHGGSHSLDEDPISTFEGEGDNGGNDVEAVSVDGAWSLWNSWVSGNCPVTCCMGNPLQSRLRRCDSPTPEGTGADCPGLHYELRTAPDTEKCGSVDNQCPIICESATSKYADTCRRCVNNYYQCDAEGAVPRLVNCPEGQVWSQHMTGCVTPSFCNAVERF